MCPGDSHRAEPGERLTHLRHTGIGTNTRGRKQRGSESPGHGVRTKLVSRNSYLKIESQVHAVTTATAASRMTASRPTLTPLFDLPRCQREWTVVLNSLRQIVYCHVKSGIACFQMPEKPELPNDLKFENGSSSGSGELSQKRRSDCKRSVSNHPEHNQLNISRGHHPQCCSHSVENQVMVKSPSCWIDPFQAKLDKRRTTKLTRTAEPLSRDVIEMKQAALWHGGKIRIDQACEDAAQGMARQPKVPRISFRSDVPMEAAMPRKMRVKKQLKLRETFNESWESNKIQKTKLHVSWKLMNLRDSVWNPLCQKIMKNTSHVKDIL